MNAKLLEKAIQVAQSSPGVGRNRNYRVGAVLFDKRGRVLATGHNSYKTHPKLKPFTEWPFIHAESHCILSHGLEHCVHTSLLVTRIQRDGSLSMAKPCCACTALASSIGLRNIFYTNWKGQIECQQLQ